MTDRRQSERRAAARPTGDRRRGRPRTTNALTEMVSFRLSLDQKRKLREVARLNGQTSQQFLREAAIEAIADCTDDHVFDRAS